MNREVEDGVLRPSDLAALFVRSQFLLQQTPPLRCTIVFPFSLAFGNLRRGQVVFSSTSYSNEEMYLFQHRLEISLDGQGTLNVVVQLARVRVDLGMRRRRCGRDDTLLLE